MKVFANVLGLTVCISSNAIIYLSYALHVLYTFTGKKRPEAVEMRVGVEWARLSIYMNLNDLERESSELDHIHPLKMEN